MVTSNFYHWAIRSFRGGAKSRALAVAALSAVVLPLAVAAASEGRRVTIGANRPMTETPAYAMPQPYEQTATSALPALRAVLTAPMMKARTMK